MEEQTMKKILMLLLALFLLGISANAQVILNVYQKGGLVHQYEINNIDSLGFTNLPLIVVPDTSTATVFDIDGNGYHAVTIGTQVWLVENLKTTKYRDGTSIPNVKVDAQWQALATGAYSDYNNTPSNSTKYGRLYNWHAIIDSRNIAPDGWHVPTDADWDILIGYLGGEGVAGGKLKETGTVHWLSPNIDATNEFGFSALPAGYRHNDGWYYGVNEEGVYWSSIDYSTVNAFYRFTSSNRGSIIKGNGNKNQGLSVRCIKDVEIEIKIAPTISTNAISSLSSTTASLGGTITNTGSSNVTSRGVCWSTNADPTVDLATKTIDGSGTSSFTSNLTGLQPLTTYYARAYATNNAGTSYGNNVSFTTCEPGWYCDISGNVYNYVTIGT